MISTFSLLLSLLSASPSDSAVITAATDLGATAYLCDSSNADVSLASGLCFRGMSDAALGTFDARLSALGFDFDKCDHNALSGECFTFSTGSN